MKAILGLILAVVLLVGAYLFMQWRAIQEAATGPAREIVSESMSKSGNVWQITFVSKFDAPLDKVYAAFLQPEKAHDYVPENVLKSEVVSENGNTKLIDVVAKLDILPPGFKVQNLRTEYTSIPADHRITSRSVDFRMADITSDYRFEATPDGKGTVLRFTQQSTDKGLMPVESLQKGALRESYLTQVRAVNRALGLAPAAATEKAG